MLRVVLGRARPDTEWSGKISGLQFNSAPGVQESTKSRGVTSTILTVPVDLEANEGSLDAEEGISEADEEAKFWYETVVS